MLGSYVTCVLHTARISNVENGEEKQKERWQSSVVAYRQILNSFVMRVGHSKKKNHAMSLLTALRIQIYPQLHFSFVLLLQYTLNVSFSFIAWLLLFRYISFRILTTYINLRGKRHARCSKHMNQITKYLLLDAPTSEVLILTYDLKMLYTNH